MILDLNRKGWNRWAYLCSRWVHRNDNTVQESKHCALCTDYLLSREHSLRKSTSRKNTIFVRWRPMLRMLDSFNRHGNRFGSILTSQAAKLHCDQYFAISCNKNLPSCKKLPQNRLKIITKHKINHQKFSQILSKRTSNRSSFKSKHLWRSQMPSQRQW